MSFRRSLQDACFEVLVLLSDILQRQQPIESPNTGNRVLPM